MSSRRGTSKGEEKALASKLFGNLGEAPLVADDEGADDGLFGKTPAAPGGETERVHDDAGDAAPTAGVWEDPDDAKSTVNVARTARLRKLRTDEAETDLDGARYVARLRKQHRRMHQRTGWADVDPNAAKKSKDPSALSHLLREGGAMVEEDGGLASSGRGLPQGTLEATRVRDANAAEPSNAVLRSVAFHANGALFLTAGLDKTVRLFDIDGTNNPKVQGVFFEDLPIHKACFANGGAAVVAAGRRDYFYVYDLARGAVERVAPLVGRPERSLESFAQSPESGSALNDPMLAFLGADGHVPLVSLKSRTCVGAVKMNGSARSAAFAADGRHLLTAGGESTTYVWDLRNQKRCVEKIVDDGALTVTALAASPSGAHVAFGSESGVVNVYETRGFRTFGSAGDGNGNEPPSTGGYRRETRPKPTRALMNLTTSADALTFNGDGQMLAMSSRLKRDALRLVHLPSCTVFSNWPSSKTPLHYVWCTAFSPTGGYLAVGNARGKALLYRIHAYGTEGRTSETF